MPKETNSRCITKHAVLFCMRCTLGMASLPRGMTCKQTHPSGETLDTCVGVMIVCIIDDCPVVNMVGVFLFHNSSFEVFFVDRQPLLVWWNVT